MRDILARCVTILLLSAALVPTSALAANNSNTPAKSSPATPNKTQDLVCWGSGPDWSIQFGSWGARYVGVNQPDKSFRGHFYWAPADKSWVWQERSSGLSPMSRPNLSAVIQESACTDPVQHKTYRYSAQVNLPAGDAVTGCCRRLKPGEAPIGPRGIPPNAAPSDNAPK